MAKKSARSKGYRKSIEKKPYLSKRDIIILCVLLAVVAVGAILLFSYDDGALKTKDGVIVDAGDNWLVVNGAASGGKRYYKLGEVGELEGYTRADEPSLSDSNLGGYRFEPEDEASDIRYVIVSASAAGIDRLTEYHRSMLGAAELGDVTTADAGYTWFSYKNEYHADEAPAEETAEAVEEAAEETAEAAEETVEAVEEAAEETAEAVEEAAEETAEAVEEAAEETAEAVEEAAEETVEAVEEAAEATAEAAEATEEADEGDDAPNHFEQGVNVCLDAGEHGTVAVMVLRDAASADDYVSDEDLLALADQAIAQVQIDEK